MNEVYPVIAYKFFGNPTRLELGYEPEHEA
jgi:hypothetical protein